MKTTFDSIISYEVLIRAVYTHHIMLTCTLCRSSRNNKREDHQLLRSPSYPRLHHQEIWRHPSCLLSTPKTPPPPPNPRYLPATKVPSRETSSSSTRRRRNGWDCRPPQPPTHRQTWWNSASKRLARAWPTRASFDFFNKNIFLFWLDLPKCFPTCTIYIQYV